MFRSNLIIILILSLSTVVNGQITLNSERQYADSIQILLGGDREVTVDGGRIDLVTEDTAYEVEWARKWKEAIGQALWYAIQTNKKPGIILIIEDSVDYRYYIQLNSALQYAGLGESIEVKLFPSDF